MNLIHWVHRHSPVRYAQDDGGDDGFARHHDQVYNRFGREQAALGDVEPLMADVEEVRAIGDESLRALSDARKPSADGPSVVLPALFQGCLCESKVQRPVLVIGVGDGADHSSAELRLMTWLFAVLPYHCRRRLTFATHDHTAQCVPSQGAVSTTRRSHENRRVVMTTRFNEVVMPGPGRSSTTVWLIDARSGKHELPEASEAAARYRGLLSSGKFDEPRRWRDFTNQFDFDDEAQGFRDAAAVRELASRPVCPGDYALFARTARGVRPGATRLLETSHALIAKFERNGRRTS